MEEDEDASLYLNDIEFKNRSIENLNLNQDEINDNPQNLYNSAEFQTEVLIDFFQKKNILKCFVFCSKCGQKCKLVKDNQTLDKYIWRCRSKKPVYDTKINIRNSSILENNRISIQMIYFLLFYCFTEKKSLNAILNEKEDFSKKLGITNINK